MVLGDPTPWVYQFVFDKDDRTDTKIIKYFVMYGPGLCIKLNSYVEHVIHFHSVTINH